MYADRESDRRKVMTARTLNEIELRDNDHQHRQQQHSIPLSAPKTNTKQTHQTKEGKK